MLAGIFTLLLLYFASPVLLLLLIGVMFRDLAFYYGGWMILAVFGLTIGIMLKITGQETQMPTLLRLRKSFPARIFWASKHRWY